MVVTDVFIANMMIIHAPLKRPNGNKMWVEDYRKWRQQYFWETHISLSYRSLEKNVFT